MLIDTYAPRSTYITMIGELYNLVLVGLGFGAGLAQVGPGLEYQDARLGIILSSVFAHL